MASLRGIDKFEYHSEGDFFHWLCKLTENRIRDKAEWFEARKRDLAREKPFADAQPSFESSLGPLNELATSTTPATMAERAEQVRRLTEAVDNLLPEQREALLLVRYEGLSMEVAAGIMGKSPDAVRKLASRAIVSLSHKLGIRGE